jgi:IS30 family transposase
MGRQGRKRQLEVEARYWQLFQSGMGTVAACRQVGITRKTRVPMARRGRW